MTAMKEILCFGDSNTWGMIPGTDQRYPWGVRWTSILQEKLQNDGIRILEDGLVGRTTVFEDSYRHRPGRNGLKALPTLLEAHRPLDGAVIMLGSNDCKSCYGATAEQIAQGLEACLDVILRDIPADKILVVAPIYLGEQVWRPDKDPEFDKRSVELAKSLYREYQKAADRKGVKLVDAALFAEPSDIDNEHLTPEGHKAMADGIYKALKANNIV